MCFLLLLLLLFSSSSLLSFCFCVIALEDEKVALFEDLSHIRTVCSTAEENIALLENNLLTYINLKNNQQDELIELFDDQVSWILFDRYVGR